MATTPRKSLVARAGAAARKVVSRAPGPGEGEQVEGAAQKKAQKATQQNAQKATPKNTEQKAPAKKAAKKAATRKSAATKSTAKKSPAKKSPAKKSTAKKTVAKNAPAKSSAARKTPVKKKAAASSLAVLAAESPWTPDELASVRQQLHDDIARLSGELAAAEEDLAGMIENSNDGAGNDQADVGSASFERDQEMVVVHNAREMLVQSRHALERIDEGTYGKCESCGNAIGKNRLMAFPRATLCLACKQREERR